jgi:hypothetical protein
MCWLFGEMLGGGLRNQHHLVLAVNPASDKCRTSHASPGERYEDRVPYLAIRDCGRAYDGR